MNHYMVMWTRTILISRRIENIFQVQEFPAGPTELVQAKRT